jgi:predicted lipid-binding transport protein (Tim44 family)
MKDNITENNSGNRLIKDIGDKLAELAQQMEKFNLAEYMNQLNNPRRYLFVNFLGGIFRGLGMALGLTIFGAFILYILQRLVVLNLPLIGDFLAELVRIILTYL